MGRVSVSVGLVGLVAAMFAAACFDPHPQPGSPCAPGNLCPDPLWCDQGICVAGDAGGPPIDACPAVSCTNDQLVDCSGTSTCAYGCGQGDLPHCRALVPSNGVDPALLAGATADVEDLTLVFDSDLGSIRIGASGPFLREAGTGVMGGIGFAEVDGMGVFTAHAFQLAEPGTWIAAGGNALVLFAADTITVDGVLDAGAIDGNGGPGGGAGGTGAPAVACAGSDGGWKMSLLAGAGAGGGGGATAGGRGADTAADGMGATGGGSGGAVCAAPSAIPLRGGAGGGAGGTENMIVRGGAGGGGGGAIALVAMTRITITGTVAAPGAGGAVKGGGSGGGGGGSGGAVFLESPDVVVRGALSANGGGGGAPQNTGITTVFGERGHLADATPALGGTFNGKHGGNGGAGIVGPTTGQTDVGGAGGGGAAGRIAIKSVTADLIGATTSPAVATSQATLE